MKKDIRPIKRKGLEFFGTILFCALVLFFTTGFFGFKPDLEELNAEIDEKFPDAPKVSMAELKKMMAEEPSLVIVDVRDREEYAVSHLKNAVNIVDPEKMNFEKDRLIVAYCSVGYRSAEFVSKARKLGYTNIYNYLGSIFEWANNGNPVYRDGEAVNEVHPYSSYWGKLLKEELHSDY